jgi:hypothetical protein
VSAVVSSGVRFVALDPATRLELREATPEEAAAFWAGQTNKRAQRGEWYGLAFSEAVRVGPVTIDYDNGPGEWHGGAGF